MADAIVSLKISVKDTERVKKMFAQGQPSVVDVQTGYKYTMTARCPKDDSFASVIRIERAGQSLSRVIFQCTSCFTEFEVAQDDIYIR
jgi:hypothetical protein